MIFITGAAGFIGFHVAQRLLAHGYDVHGLDSLNDYYDPKLKDARLGLLKAHQRFKFHKVDISDESAIGHLFSIIRPEVVIHLAAQVGVRHSLRDPHSYVSGNLAGFLNVLEGCRHGNIKHLVYASSSSVYGLNESMPFRTNDNASHPMSLYGATKRANELMAHSYSHLYRLPTSGLRFFTVYGPWGRPDMAYYRFTKAIIEGSPISVYNNGQMTRDFTYIDDVVESIFRLMDRPPSPDPAWNAALPQTASSSAPYRLYNIGNRSPVELVHFINLLEKCLQKKANLLLTPAQPGDVLSTAADVSDLEVEIGYRPDTTIEHGLQKFVDWYRNYHRT